MTIEGGLRQHRSSTAPGVSAWLALVVSVSLHGLWMVVGSFATPRIERPPPTARLELAWFEATRDDAPREAPPLSAAASSPPVADVERLVRPPARKHALRTQPARVAPRDAAQPADSPAPENREAIAPATLEAPATHATPPADALSPRRAAETLYASAMIDSPSSITSVESDEAKAERVSKKLNAELYAAAAEIRHLAKRAPPKLERKSDGGYRWKGPLFTAEIAADGMVSFDDAPDFSLDGFGIGPFVIGRDPRRGRPPPDASLSSYLREMLDYLPILKLFGHFDLEAALARAHRDDPHVAERLWFLQQTEALRQKMGDEAAAAPPSQR